MSEHVTIMYQKEKSHCPCCHQSLPHATTSPPASFDFSKDTCIEWLETDNWRVEAEDEHAFYRLTEEFVCDTIGFYSTSSGTRLIVHPDEIRKMQAFIKEKVLT